MTLIYLLCLHITRIFYNLLILMSFLPSSAPIATKRTRFFDLILNEFRKLNDFKYLYNQKPKPLLLTMSKLNEEESN